MENRSRLSINLIVCGMLLVMAALALVGYQMTLSARDVHDHRTQASALLRDSTIKRVTLSEWEAPTITMAWATLAGGFLMIGIGIRQVSACPSSGKPGRRDDLD